MNSLLALTIANLRMMARNRHSLFWALALPLLLIVVFGLFDIDATGSANIAIIDQANTSHSQGLTRRLAEIEFLKLVNLPGGVEAARQKLSKGELDYLLIIPQGFGEAETSSNPSAPVPVRLIYQTSNRKRNQLVEGVVQNLAAEVGLSDSPIGPPVPMVRERIQVTEASYLDMVLMGLVSLAIMNHSIIAIAVKVSTYRNQAVFKRLLVTPLAIWKYFASEVTAHLALALVQAAIIMAIGVGLFGARIHGNVLWIFLIVALGNLLFLNIGFIVSAWANTPSAASGMGNVIALPMIFLSGTFFSTSALPGVLPSLAKGLPLTPMLSALREVAINNATLWETWPQLAVLVAWIGGTALVAIKVFRFS